MRNKILAALFAALTIAGSAAAVAGMSFNGPHAAHSSAMSFNGHGG